MRPNDRHQWPAEVPDKGAQREPAERWRLPPIDDPTEAMKFCRALAAAMEKVSKGADRHLRPLPLTPAMRQVDRPVASPTLSIVIPVFNEAENLHTLHARLSGAMARLGIDYE